MPCIAPLPNKVTLSAESDGTFDRWVDDDGQSHSLESLPRHFDRATILTKYEDEKCECCKNGRVEGHARAMLQSLLLSSQIEELVIHYDCEDDTGVSWGSPPLEAALSCGIPSKLNARRVLQTWGGNAATGPEFFIIPSTAGDEGSQRIVVGSLTTGSDARKQIGELLAILLVDAKTDVKTYITIVAPETLDTQIILYPAEQARMLENMSGTCVLSTAELWKFRNTEQGAVLKDLC